MFIVTFAALGLGLAGLQAEPQQNQVSTGWKASCKSQTVHLPAGKTGSQRVIVRCTAPSKALASAATKRDSGE